MKRADVRMIQTGDNTGFPLEALASGLVDRDVRPQHFDGDGPPESRVARAIDFAHASAADPGFQAVGSEIRALQVLLRPSGDGRNTRRLEEIAGTFVRIKKAATWR